MIQFQKAFNEWENELFHGSEPSMHEYCACTLARTYHEEDNDGGNQDPGGTGVIVAKVIVNLTCVTG